MTIHIENLKFKCIIGILNFEREKSQDVIINTNINYTYDNNFIDYAKVVETIKKIMLEKKFSLIEDALDSIILKLIKDYKQINSIELKITKPSILPDCNVSVSNFYKTHS